MEQNRFLNEAQEQVVLIPKPRRIEINRAVPQRAYGLFDTITGTQVRDFVKGNDGKIEFKDLDPSTHYDVGVIENMGNEKPEFTMIWTPKMRDNTEEVLNNSDDLPIVYPKIYIIKYKDGNSNGVYDLIDDNGETVGQVTKLFPQGDKPKFVMTHTFRMKDNTIK